MIPSEAWTADLSDFEFRLLATLCRLGATQRAVEARIEELGALTGGRSKSTVLRALRGLEAHSLIEVVHTRKQGGFQGISKYRVLAGVTDDTLESQSVTADTTQSVTGDTATGDQVANLLTSSHDRMAIGHDSQESNTTYYSGDCVPAKRTEVKVVVKYDDGDDLGGFGLLEPKDNTPAPKKSDPKTRWKRPQEEWTPADVAAEFSYLVGKKIPWAPGLVNQGTLRIALAKQRKDFGVTALIELEVLKAFMADAENFRDVGDKVPKLYKRYLGMFRTHINQAHEALGLPAPGREGNVTRTASERHILVASDGAEFDDTIAGRSFLKKHEERLAQRRDASGV